MTLEGWEYQAETLFEESQLAKGDSLAIIEDQAVRTFDLPRHVVWAETQFREIRN